MTPLIRPSQTVLFQGDSITDAGRDRDDPLAMGWGYASLAAALFSAQHPDSDVSFLNRGISGNRVPDLLSRWDSDCVALRPDWVSIMIGINDTWRRFDRNDPTSAEEYEAGYRRLLRQTRQSLPEARLILLEPFVLPYPEDRETWREDLDPKIHAVRRLAREFEAVLIPLDGLLNARCGARPPAFWAHDGVHPTQEGHAAIALEWLKAVRAV